jgi:hypothetical protein
VPFGVRDPGQEVLNYSAAGANLPPALSLPLATADEPRRRGAPPVRLGNVGHSAGQARRPVLRVAHRARRGPEGPPDRRD